MYLQTGQTATLRRQTSVQRLKNHRDMGCGGPSSLTCLIYLDKNKDRHRRPERNTDRQW